MGMREKQMGVWVGESSKYLARIRQTRQDGWDGMVLCPVWDSE